MRTVILLFALFPASGHSLEGCPGAKWTDQVKMAGYCAGFACFERTVVDENGKICARTIDTAYSGYFVARIFDAAGLEHASEKYLLDPDGNEISRVEVSDPSGHLLYTTDENGESFRPDGSPLDSTMPNPAGLFYEELIGLFDEMQP